MECSKNIKKVLKIKYKNKNENSFKDFIYFFMRDTGRERGRDIGRRRSRLHAGSLMWDSILEPLALGQRQALNC